MINIDICFNIKRNIVKYVYYFRVLYIILLSYKRFLISLQK